MRLYICMYGQTQYSNTLASKIIVNDRVKIDGNVSERVSSVVRTVVGATYYMYNVKLDLG